MYGRVRAWIVSTKTSRMLGERQSNEIQAEAIKPPNQTPRTTSSYQANNRQRQQRDRPASGHGFKRRQALVVRDDSHIFYSVT